MQFQDLRISYSQFGEDLVLLQHLQKQQNGFYVDVGAFHPWKYSNTALLHNFMGWKGINIDANPSAIELFKEARPNDINVVAAISDVVEELEFAIFNHPAVNTLDKNLREKQQGKAAFKVKEVLAVKTQTLENIFNQYSDRFLNVDLLSVDAEGFDFKVLKSNNWEIYQPKIILVEQHGLQINQLNSDPTYLFLTSKGYRLVSRCFVTSIYLKR
ncbi:MAG: FkbM family methyltransferase [Okeania sp. SIO2D1]|nr:FkbM family methyltransferase [Okeania sp. SIO2D1]